MWIFSQNYLKLSHKEISFSCIFYRILTKADHFHSNGILSSSHTVLTEIFLKNLHHYSSVGPLKFERFLYSITFLQKFLKVQNRRVDWRCVVEKLVIKASPWAKWEGKGNFVNRAEKSWTINNFDRSEKPKETWSTKQLERSERPK